MKNLIALAMCMFLGFGVSAQTDQGSRMLGGNLTLDLAFDDDDDAFLFSFNPNYGVFIRNNFAVGGTLGIQYSKRGSTKRTDFSIGPFARYYVLGNDNLKMFLHGQFEYTSSKTDFGDDDIKSNGYGIFAGPGISYFLTDAVAVDFILGYNYNDFGKDSNDESVTSSNLRLTAGFQIFL